MYVTPHRRIIFLLFTISHTKLTFPVRVKFRKERKKKTCRRSPSQVTPVKGSAPPPPQPSRPPLTGSHPRLPPLRVPPAPQSPPLGPLAAVPFPVSSSVLHPTFYARVLAIFDFLEHQNNLDSSASVVLKEFLLFSSFCSSTFVFLSSIKILALALYLIILFFVSPLLEVNVHSILSRFISYLTFSIFVLPVLEITPTFRPESSYLAP